MSPIPPATEPTNSAPETTGPAPVPTVIDDVTDSLLPAESVARTRHDTARPLSAPATVYVEAVADAIGVPARRHW